MTDSVRQAIVQIACKSLASSGDDVQCEIERLKAANLLPCDFKLPKGGGGGGRKKNQKNNNSQPKTLKNCAAQLVEGVICKVRDQMDCSTDPDDQQPCELDVEELVKSAASSNGCCVRPKPNSNDECCDAREQVSLNIIEIFTSEVGIIYATADETDAYMFCRCFFLFFFCFFSVRHKI